MAIHSDFSLGLTLASGAIQTFVAAVFFRFMFARPQWGLGWLGLSYAFAAWLNLTAGYAMQVTRGDSLFVPLQVANMIVGVTCMGFLVTGVRQYLGFTPSRPLLSISMVWGAYLSLIAARRLWPTTDLAIVGPFLAAVIFTYLAVLGVKAARREPGVGHAVAAAMLMLYPPLVWIAYQFGLNPAEMSYWGSVPFSLAGMGLMAATMGRLRVALRDLNETLESRVKDRTQQLQDVIDGLESFNRMVSHDLRGPLGGVHGISQIAAQALEQGDQERALRLVRAIHTASGSLTTLVSDLLSLAKASQSDVQKQSASLQVIVSDALQWLEVSKGEGCTRHVRCEGLSMEVAVDPALMRQVMVNLIGNAIKYSSQSSRQDVTVSAHSVEGGCELTVADHGIGFDHSQADQLFKPFRRLQADGRFEGFGVGLTIVHRIVTGHGGRVWAEATPGQGARFHVWLPGAPGVSW